METDLLYKVFHSTLLSCCSSLLPFHHQTLPTIDCFTMFSVTQSPTPFMSQQFVIGIFIFLDIILIQALCHNYEIYFILTTLQDPLTFSSTLSFKGISSFNYMANSLLVFLVFKAALSLFFEHRNAGLSIKT